MLKTVIEAIADSQATFGTTGNASERRDETRFCITPSGIAWGCIDEDDLVELSVADGMRLAGAREPSTEWRAHQALYHAHPWVNGIVHLHSRYATTLAVLGLPVRAIHYQLASVADEVPIVPYATFGTEELAASVAAAIKPRVKAVLVANHGLFAVGETIVSAWTCAQEVEWTAMIQYQAMTVGTPHVLSAADLDAARQAFLHYGQRRPE